MVVITPAESLETLRHIHTKLDTHFQRLHDERKQMEPAAPVFALEHDLGRTELQLLCHSVRSTVAQGLGARHRLWWLPYVVYAAEVGYDYVGDEYWRSFEKSTPGWQGDNRRWIKAWFSKFSAHYGGAVPQGAFAEHFTIISWPITHAVLPTYMQRQLAQLLYEFRTGLSSDLLHNPDGLGVRLAARAEGYTERFRIFCQNTALLGQVATALLSGEDEESPYLTSSTLERLVSGLSHERQSRQWLASARRSASQIRASGFKPSPRAGEARSAEDHDRGSSPSDPRLFLRYLDGTWNAYAGFFNLTPLNERLPEAYEELRTMRARVVGASRKLPTGALVYDGQEVRLVAWPDPAKPFVQLERGSKPVNSILADQCVLTTGPWWSFRVQGTGLAVQVKGGFVRPGHHYILVGSATQAPPAVDWCEPTSITASGVKAYRLNAPKRLTDAEAAALVTCGVSAVSAVAIRPVGMVASAWDGEGEAEWLAGEPAMVGIRAELSPSRCVLMVDEVPHFMRWPAGQSELIVVLEGLDAGRHSVTIELYGDGEQRLSTGALSVTVRDPQVRPETATSGEGIRLLASPARPTLAELWNEQATVVVHGPRNAEVELSLTLRAGDGTSLASVRRTARLPITEKAWVEHAKSVKGDQMVKDSYDDAESCVLTVARSGIGLASLSCERGFQPLRWRFLKKHNRAAEATLHDRTDRGSTTVELFTVDEPLRGINYAPDCTITMPPRGGLLRAATGDLEAVAIAPTKPNAVFALGPVRPSFPRSVQSPAAIMRFVRAYQMWATADLPADPFAEHHKHVVLESITRTIVVTVCGARWAKLEHAMENATDLADHIDDMQRAVGESMDQKALATSIGRNLYRWLTPPALLSGFAELMELKLRESGIDGHPSAARFLLMLAGRPGGVIEWDSRDRDHLLERIVASPVLLRSARYAVLATRAINDIQSAGRGF